MSKDEALAKLNKSLRFFQIASVSLIASWPFTVSLLTYLHDAHVPAWLNNGIIAATVIKGFATVAALVGIAVVCDQISWAKRYET